MTKIAEKENFIISKIKSGLGFLICTMMFVAWMIALYIVLYGNFKYRFLLFIQMIYQYFFCKDKNETFCQVLRWLKPQNFMYKFEVHYEEELSKSNSLISYHPHGIISVGFGFSYLLEEKLASFSPCVSRALIYLPLSGMLATWFGTKSVDGGFLNKYMKKGR
jgi:hypothetical protein